MTPEYIASKLALLPQFEVVSLGHETGEQGKVTLLSGYFSMPVGEEEQGANLFLPDLRFLDGLLAASRQGEHLRTVEAGGYCWSDILESEVLNATLAFFSNYDARRMRLVLDPEIQWTDIQFKPQRALQARIIGTDGKLYRKLSAYEEGIKLEDGESIVEGAWDHEHCVFCWNRIDGDNAGYYSEHNGNGEWVCSWCYHNAVHPHDPRPLLIPCKSRK